MMTLEQKLSAERSDKNLVLLCKECVETYKDNPKKQLECLKRLATNVYSTPKVFDAVIKSLGKILATNSELTSSVVDVLRSILDVKHLKHVNSENCDHMTDMLKETVSNLGSFEAAKVKVFIKDIATYKKTLQSASRAQTFGGRSLGGGTGSQATTKYGVVRPNREPTTKYGVVKPNRNPTTKYGVVVPDNSYDM